MATKDWKLYGRGKRWIIFQNNKTHEQLTLDYLIYDKKYIVVSEIGSPRILKRLFTGNNSKQRLAFAKQYMRDN